MSEESGVIALVRVGQECVGVGADGALESWLLSVKAKGHYVNEIGDSEPDAEARQEIACEAEAT